MATITVKKDLCTRCGVCSEVCTQGIIGKPDEDNLPFVLNEKEGFCIQCGHCEAFCPSDALTLNIFSDEKIVLPKDAGIISPEDMAFYLKKRRSVRRYKKEPVSKDKILEVLDIARYAASGGNGQPVEWIVIHDSEKVQKIAALTAEWMKSLIDTPHPMSGYVPVLINAWENGNDVICRNAPHLLFAHIPENNPVAVTDAVIAMTHFDVAAPAFDIGTCWAGFVAMAAWSYEPLQKEFCLPQGRKSAYAMMFGYPKYKPHAIPGRNPLKVTWQ